MKPRRTRKAKSRALKGNSRRHRAGTARRTKDAGAARTALSFTPSDFDEAVQEGRYDEACEFVLEFLDMVEAGGGIDTPDQAVRDQGYTWWASNIMALLSQPSLHLSDEAFSRLATRHRGLTNLFGCSDFGNADQLLRIMVSQIEAESGIDRDAVARALLSYSLYSEVDLDFKRFMETTPDIASRAYLGIMSGHVVLTESAFAKRRQLLAVGPQLAEVEIPFDWLDRVSMPWFLCSYDDGPGKHDIKVHLNRIFRAALAREGITDLLPPEPRPERERPTVVVAVERFESHHAMFRCYAPPIRQLKEHFDLVLLCEPGAVDSRARSLFEHVVQLPFTPSGFKRAVEDLARIAPDIMYYPSVGMSARIIAMANLRIAPIQIATMGHPATTMAPTIDYVAIEGHDVGDPELFSETLLILADGANQFEIRHDAVAIRPDIRERAETVRIAVPSSAFKLNPGFLSVCRRIQDESERPLEFSFFPTGTGLKHHHLEKRIQEWMPNARVYASTDYNTYIQNLNRCDIQLSSFPFGGTNSSMDALRQGIPIITIEGDEIHSRSDAWYIRRIDGPEWLIAHTHDEFVQAALRLIHDDEERVALSNAILAVDIDAKFHDWRYRLKPKDYSALFSWLYENHETIRADGRKVWTTEARGRDESRPVAKHDAHDAGTPGGSPSLLADTTVRRRASHEAGERQKPFAVEPVAFRVRSD